MHIIPYGFSTDLNATQKIHLFPFETDYEEVHQKYDYIDPHDPMRDCSPFIAKSDSPKHQFFVEYANQLKDTEGFHVDLIPIQSVCCTWILPQNVNSPMIIEAAKAAIEEFNRLNRLKGANLKLSQILSSNCMMIESILFFLTFQCSDGCFYEAKIYQHTKSDYEFVKFRPAKFWPRKNKYTYEEGGAEPKGSQIIAKRRKNFLVSHLLYLCEQVKPAFPALAQLILLNDEEVLTDVCWALLYLSDGTNDKIQAVIDVGVCPWLVEFLTHPSPFPAVLIPALRTVGNIVTGDDLQTQCIISHQALPCLLNLLTNNYKMSIKKEACWTISNITAGNKEQIHAVIEANIIGPLIHLLQNSEFDIKKEAAWANLKSYIWWYSRANLVPWLENILKEGEADKSLGNTRGVNVYAQMIDDAEGLEKIENLQSRDNNIEIYEKAVKILETYWKDTNEGGVEG
ncbi:hypothetical protein QYF36_021655 [Acer negundo]|nr:hypothetical protein QYF36_021655 [Acer negundo]